MMILVIWTLIASHLISPNSAEVVIVDDMLASIYETAQLQNLQNPRFVLDKDLIDFVSEQDELYRAPGDYIIHQDCTQIKDCYSCAANNLCQFHHKLNSCGGRRNYPNGQPASISWSENDCDIVLKRPTAIWNAISKHVLTKERNTYTYGYHLHTPDAFNKICASRCTTLCTCDEARGMATYKIGSVIKSAWLIDGYYQNPNDASTKCSVKAGWDASAVKDICMNAFKNSIQKNRAAKAGQSSFQVDGIHTIEILWMIDSASHPRHGTCFGRIPGSGATLDTEVYLKLDYDYSTESFLLK